MATSESRREKAEDCLLMGGDAGQYAWSVAMDTPNDANMFGRLREGDIVGINVDRRDNLGIFDHMFLTWGAEGEKFSLLRDKSHIVALAVLKRKEEEIVEAVDVIGKEGTVISLANGRNGGGSKLNSKVRELGHVELVVVGELVQLVAVDTPLLDAKLVDDGAHYGLGPLAISQSIAKPIVKVNKALIRCSCFKGIDNDALLRNEIEGALGIKEEQEHRFLEGVEGEVQGLREE